LYASAWDAVAARETGAHVLSVSCGLRQVAATIVDVGYPVAFCDLEAVKFVPRMDM
jgi:hypothetical protein